MGDVNHYSIGIVGVHQNLESDIRRLEPKRLPAGQVRFNQQNAAYTVVPVWHSEGRKSQYLILPLVENINPSKGRAVNEFLLQAR